MPSLVEIGPVVLEEIFKFLNVFSLFRNHLPLDNGKVLHLNKLESPAPKDAICQVWLILAQWFWRGRFLFSSMYNCYLVIISPWKRAGPFIWSNLNPLYTRMLCAKFCWNWPSISGEENFLPFHYHLPWKRVGLFTWTNYYPLHPRMLFVMFGWNWPSGSIEDF